MINVTLFAYSNARVSETKFNDTNGLTVTVDVTNKGKVAGKETVQVCVHEMNDMPLVSVLLFQQNMLPMPAEEIAAGLLHQMHEME